MSGITDEDQNDTKALEQIFDLCDPLMTGQVKANELVTTLNDCWIKHCSERDSKVYQSDLMGRLDPRQDNCYVERDVFVRCGIEWAKFLKVCV